MYIYIVLKYIILYIDDYNHYINYKKLFTFIYSFSTAFIFPIQT